MKAVVTGGAGFIGSHLVEGLLNQGTEVSVVDNLSTGKVANLSTFKDQIKFFAGDVRDQELLKKVFAEAEVVFHLAAIPSVPRSIRELILTNDVNVSGAVSVFQAAKDCRVRRVIFATSSSVYGDSDVSPKVETLPLNPISPYGVQKATMELYARVLGELFDLETIGLRYFNVFGPRQDPDSEYSAVIPLFIKKMIQGEAPTIFGDGETSRDFTYVSNVVSANLLAAKVSKSATGQVYNIAAGQAISLNELVAVINKKLKINLKPNYKDFRPGDIKHSLADISQAQQKLGFEVQISFAEGVAKTTDFFNHPNL